ncbi:MAG TPA: hypothetical protein VJ774_01995, partial [Actinomycetota bacterium]|nr:hypothetical protein [Actinomycetota bacterium]
EEVISGRVRELVDRQMSELGEQLQLLYDRTAIAATSLHDLVASLGDRMRVESREAGNETREAVLVTTQQMSDATMEAVQDVARSAATAVNRTIEERVTGLAQLGRADSEAIRDELVRRTAVIDDRLAALLDERLGAATHQILEVIDRNMIRMMDGLEANFERLSAQVGDRAATSVDLAIGARFDDVLARLHESAAVIERGSSEVRTVLDVRLSALDERFASLGGRLTALVKLTRSDSEAIANQVLAGQDVTKQALRAMEHLQTSLPAEVIQMVEQRFASIAETIERSNEMLAHRIDRMAESLGRRQNDDIQIVIDRMGDAMHALATLGKGDPRVSAIEID